MQVAELPYLDEHATTVTARIDDVWPALLEVVDGSFSGSAFAGAGAAAFARAAGCDPRTASGPRPLAVGSTIPGFRVTTAIPGSELVLEGRHHFSTYALTFRLEPVGSDRSRLSAESRATFPGVTGGAYRLLVVGTRGHVVAVRRMLSGIKHRAERARSLDG
jgi:hypothetical protein